MISENKLEFIISIFTICKGEIKTLLLSEANDNLLFLTRKKINEVVNIEKEIKSIVKSKTGIENINIYLSNVYSKRDKKEEDVLLSVSYIVITDEMEITLENNWIDINNIPDVLAFDHKEILTDSIKTFKELILKKEVLKQIYKNGFTMPELQRVYETILDKKYDRRNFHRMIMRDEDIIDTGLFRIFEGKKKAKVYKYK